MKKAHAVSRLFIGSGVSILTAVSAHASASGGIQTEVAGNLLKDLVTNQIVEKIDAKANLFQIQEGVLEKLMAPSLGLEDEAAKTIQMLNEVMGEDVTVTRREKFEIANGTQDF